MSEGCILQKVGREDRREGGVFPSISNPFLPSLHSSEWNELHHLQIMESLGGDARWLDRFLARHSAICKAGGKEGGREKGQGIHVMATQKQ